MISGILVNGEKEKKLSLIEEKEGLLGVSKLILSKVMENERESVMLMLLSGFKKLRYEDLEEVYSDGCLVLWNKMVDENFELMEKGINGYLRKVCWNIGMHYLRKVKENVVSFDELMERGNECVVDECGIKEIFDVIYEIGIEEDEKYKKMDEIWEKLSKVNRMILESYYVDGCKMEEIAKRVGYKNGNSVKSKKNKVLKKIIEMCKEEEMVNSDHLPLAA